MAKKNPHMQGNMIEPLPVAKNKSVKDFIDNVFGASGYNARRLHEACDIYARMIGADASIALTLAGAMTPIGMSGPFIELIKKGSWISSSPRAQTATTTCTARSTCP